MNHRELPKTDQRYQRVVTALWHGEHAKVLAARFHLHNSEIARIRRAENIPLRKAPTGSGEVWRRSMKNFFHVVLVSLLLSGVAWADHLDWMPREWQCCNHRDCFAAPVSLLNLLERRVFIGEKEITLNEETKLSPSLAYQTGYVCVRDLARETFAALIAPDNLRCVFYRPGGS